MDKQAHVTTEQVSYGYSESEIPTEEYALHCHNFYEVYFFLDGDVDYLVEGTQYKPTPNSLLLLSPQCISWGENKREQALQTLLRSFPSRYSVRGTACFLIVRFPVI